MRLCKKQCVLKVAVIDNGTMKEIELHTYCSVSVFGLKHMLANQLKIDVNDQVLSAIVE